MEPMMGEMDNIMSQAEMLPASEVNSQLDQIVVKLQRLQAFVTDGGMFLPAYIVKKSQKTINSLNTQFRKKQEKEKPKKELGSKQKAAKTPVIVHDISSLSVVDSAPGYSNSNFYSLSNMTDQMVILTLYPPHVQHY